MILEKLKEIDDVAYLRFASVYKSFKSADSFRKEMEKLET
jgi:transcriptional repressor NrdR